MAGNGNLILKRGSGIPSDEQNGGTLTLLKGMPAAQIVGISRPSNLTATQIGEYAYDNYPNRLWIGFDGYGTLAQSVGGVGGVAPASYSLSPPTDATKRPIWMGAEIRADTAVYGSGTSSPDDVPVVFKADWTNAVDTVLVTQKAIKTYVDAQVGGKGSMSSFNVTSDEDGLTPLSIEDGDTLSILGSTGINTEYNNTTLTINLDLNAISTQTPGTVTNTYLAGTNGSFNQKYTIGNVLAEMTGDVTCAASTGATTVNTVNITPATTGTTYYPVFANGSGKNKTLYVDAAATTLEYNLSSNTLKAENLSTSSLKLTESINTVTINPASSSTTHTLTLPANNASGFLQNNGSGTLSWSAATASSSVKFSNETDNNVKYPIAFIANAASDNPSTFGSLSDAAETTGYLKTDWMNGATNGLFYNPGSTATTSGTFPQPNVLGGTLYAGFFSGVMDGGTWT